MIKKMINVKRPKISKLKKNILSTFQTTRNDTNTSYKSIIKTSTKSLSIMQQKPLINSLTEYSQSFMKLATDFIKENNFEVEKEREVKRRHIKKVGDLNIDSNKWLNMLKKNEFDDENLKLSNYDEIIEIIRDNIADKKSLKKFNGIKSVQLPNSCRGEFLHKNSSKVFNTSTNKIYLNKQNSKQVESITHDLYYNIFSTIFNKISIIPGFVDRNYIRFNSLNLVTLCFIKPLLEVLFKTNCSITENKFISLCFMICKKMTIQEKKKFILTSSLNLGNCSFQQSLDTNDDLK